MDNRTIDVVAEGWESFSKAIELVWSDRIKATHYQVVKLAEKTTYHKDKDGNVTQHYTHLAEDERGTPTLILCWFSDGKATPLPFPLTQPDGIAFCRAWLGNSDIWGRQPDHDGDNKPGWRVFTGAWGHVTGSGDIVGIQPAWAMYGK